MTRERAAALPANDWRSKNLITRSPGSRAIWRWSRNCADRRAPRRAPGAVAIAWTLRQPAVTGAIVGFRSPKQVEGPLAAATLRLAPDDIAGIDALTAF